MRDKLGITFQQIQNYAKGTNRFGASRLQAIASILGVPIAFFFNARQPPARWMTDPFRICCPAS
jgi:transcriptional regulator with XRE-family HTH domain